MVPTVLNDTGRTLISVKRPLSIYNSRAPQKIYPVKMEKLTTLCNRCYINFTCLHGKTSTPNHTWTEVEGANDKRGCTHENMEITLTVAD